MNEGEKERRERRGRRLGKRSGEDESGGEGKEQHESSVNLFQKSTEGFLLYVQE